MKKYLLAVYAVLLFLPFQIRAQTPNQSTNNDVDYPHVPRVSAYEAYAKYKSGKAIIFHSGGANFNNRHIVGALNLAVENREPMLRKLPKEGIEIFIYCY